MALKRVGDVILMRLMVLCVEGSATTTTYSGYLVDTYCYGLVNSGGTALDGTDVIRRPQDHTLHCLRDPPQCYAEFYVARKSNSSDEWHIGFILDKIGNDKALELLRTYPYGHERDNVAGHFLVTASGTDVGEGILETTSIVECTTGVETCDSICEGNCNTTLGDGGPKPRLAPSKLLLLHAQCMVHAWGLLLPLGIICARHLKKSETKVGDQPLWFACHRVMMPTGVLLFAVGFGAIVYQRAEFGGTHFQDPHEVLGLVTVLLGFQQPLNALLRPHKSDTGGQEPARAYWELWHKNSGRVASLLGFVTIGLGVLKAHNFGFAGAFVPVLAVLGILFVGTLIPLDVLFETGLISVGGAEEEKSKMTEMAEAPEAAESS